GGAGAGLSGAAESGRPTVVKEGRPGATSTSTKTSSASTPRTVAERTHASMRRVSGGADRASTPRIGYSVRQVGGTMVEDLRSLVARGLMANALRNDPIPQPPRKPEAALRNQVR